MEQDAQGEVWDKIIERAKSRSRRLTYEEDRDAAEDDYVLKAEDRLWEIGCKVFKIFSHKSIAEHLVDWV